MTELEYFNGEMTSCRMIFIPSFIETG